MKIFCDCNSFWFLDFPYWVFDLPLHTKRKITKSRLNITIGKCPKCEYNYWYDADHENMMFDLKNMNQQ